MGIFEQAEELINLILALSNAVPGITSAILALLALFPKDVQQEWTEERVRAKVAEFRAVRDANAAERDRRRTEEEPPAG